MNQIPEGFELARVRNLPANIPPLGAAGWNSGFDAKDARKSPDGDPNQVFLERPNTPGTRGTIGGPVRLLPRPEIDTRDVAEGQQRLPHVLAKSLA